MIKNKRKKNGLTQSELAERLGVNKSHLSRLERKIEGYHPSTDLIVKMSKELKCCPFELFAFFTDINCKYFKKRKD